MRNLILVLLAAGAIAFVGYVFLKTPPPAEPTWDGGIPDPVGEGPQRAPTMVEAASRVIRPGHVEPGGEVDWGAVMDREVYLDASKHKTGADLLDALEAALGKELPIRFVSEADVAEFRETPLHGGDDETPVKHHMPDIIEIVRSLGYVLEPRERFMIFRKARASEQPPREDEGGDGNK